eukprot:5781051-Pyramimonas_sp.AAC.1
MNSGCTPQGLRWHTVEAVMPHFPLPRRVWTLIPCGPRLARAFPASSHRRCREHSLLKAPTIRLYSTTVQFGAAHPKQLIKKARTHCTARCTDARRARAAGINVARSTHSQVPAGSAPSSDGRALCHPTDRDSSHGVSDVWRGAAATAGAAALCLA